MSLKLFLEIKTAEDHFKKCLNSVQLVRNGADNSAAS